jgi:hypothetical protein
VKLSRSKSFRGRGCLISEHDDPTAASGSRKYFLEQIQGATHIPSRKASTQSSDFASRATHRARHSPVAAAPVGPRLGMGRLITITYMVKET